jgi:indolepyruvate ferredoxin oxidoreductase alpha subunit
LKPYRKDIEKYVMMPGMAKKRHVILEERMNRIAEDANAMAINRIEMGDTRIGIITSGIVYQYAREALPKASFLKLGMVYPLPRKKIEDFAKKVDRLIVLEELEPFIEEQIRSWGITVEGKELFTRQGEYSAAMIRKAITQEEIECTPPEALPVRPPVMCPGCPHRGVYYALNRLHLQAMGDIGCYTLGALPPLSTIDSCLCMGASIGMAHGMEKARGAGQSEKTVAVIGDSTFFHSGITGLIDVVYNGGCSTVVILDNRTTGMTGHQNHPGTGKTIKGEDAPAVDIEALVRSIGVTDVQTVDPFDIEGTMAALKKAVQTNAPSVVIAKRPCALLNRAKHATPFTVDAEKCARCGMCMKLGCPAMQEKDGRMMTNEALCTACGLCAAVCRFGAVGGEAHV